MWNSACYVQALVLYIRSKGHCYCVAGNLEERMQVQKQARGEIHGKVHLFSCNFMIAVPFSFSPHYVLNHAFTGLIMLGKKDGNDGRKFDSPWCCTPTLTPSPAPKLAKGEVTSFPRPSARGHGSSGVATR
jgi:hypothetical protein